MKTRILTLIVSLSSVLTSSANAITWKPPRTCLRVQDCPSPPMSSQVTWRGALQNGAATSLMYSVLASWASWNNQGMPTPNASGGYAVLMSGENGKFILCEEHHLNTPEESVSCIFSSRSFSGLLARQLVQAMTELLGYPFAYSDENFFYSAQNHQVEFRGVEASGEAYGLSCRFTGEASAVETASCRDQSPIISLKESAVATALICGELRRRNSRPLDPASPTFQAAIEVRC